MKAIIRAKALQLRKKGFSISEIQERLNVSKSTVSVWVRPVNLSAAARRRLKKRIIVGQKKGAMVRVLQKNEFASQLSAKVRKELSKIYGNKTIQKLACALLHWCEGEKTTGLVVFVNSDPLLIKTFLRLFRASFTIDEKKFRVLLHLHSYHNEITQMRYWSNITKIPLSQFLKTHKKSNSGKSIHPDYQGCVSLRYYDHTIAKQLECIWKQFGNNRRVV